MHFASKSCSPGTAMFSLPSLWMVSTGAPSQRRIKKSMKYILLLLLCVWVKNLHACWNCRCDLNSCTPADTYYYFSLSITIEAQNAKTWRLDSDSPKKHKQLIRKTYRITDWWLALMTHFSSIIAQFPILTSPLRVKHTVKNAWNTTLELKWTIRVTPLHIVQTEKHGGVLQWSLFTLL